jgi:hypothetical protein
VLLGEPVQGLVRQGVERVVQVADHRQRPWARRQVQGAGAASKLELGEYGGDESEKESVAAHEQNGCGFCHWS